MLRPKAAWLISMIWSDKMCSMVKKWQTMIKARVDVKTTNSYLLHLFCVGFTKKRQQKLGKTSCAQHRQVHQIHRLVEIMTWEPQTGDTKEVVSKLIPDSIGKGRKACQSIYQLHDIIIRKVKMLKRPKFEWGKLMELPVEVVILRKLLGKRQVLKLNELMDTSHQSMNLLKIQTLMVTKYLVWGWGEKKVRDLDIE